MTLPLAIELRPSRKLIAVLCAGHLLAFIVAAVALPTVPAVILAAALAASFFGQLRVARLRSRDSIQTLRITQEDRIEFRDRDGVWHASTVRAHGYATSWLIILPLTDEGGHRRQAILLSDSCAPEDLRKLRVWLRWGGGNSRHSPSSASKIANTHARK